MSTDDDVEERRHSRRSSNDDRSERKKKKKSRDDESVRSSRSQHKKKRSKDEESSRRDSASTKGSTSSKDRKKKSRSKEDEMAEETVNTHEAHSTEGSTSSGERKKKKKSSRDESSHRSKTSSRYKEESSSRSKKHKRSSKDRHHSSSRDSSAESDVERKPKAAPLSNDEEEEDTKVGPVGAPGMSVNRKSSATDKLFTVRKGSTEGGKRWDHYSHDDSQEGSNQFSASSISSGFSVPQASSRALGSKAEASRVGAVAVKAGDVPDRIQNMLDRKFNEYDDPKQAQEKQRAGAAAASASAVGAHYETAVPDRIQHMLEEKFKDFGSSKANFHSSAGESSAVLSPVQSKIQAFQPTYVKNSPSTTKDKLNGSFQEEPAEAHQNLAPAGNDFSVWGTQVQKTSVAVPTPDDMANRMMDDQEMALSSAEKTEARLAAGLCPDCGRTRTHEKIKYGPFQTFRKMEPLSTPGHVYKGYCLFCNNLHDLRRYLHEPYLREQDIDGSMAVPITAGTHKDDGKDTAAPAGIFGGTDEEEDLSRKKRRVQICLCVAVLAVIAGGIGLAVTLVGNASVTPPVVAAAAPTPAPGPLGWHQVGSDISEPIESFGFKVSVSEPGNRVAVASPKASANVGQVDVYEFLNTTSQWQNLGQSILGDFQEDMAGFAIDLSSDGKYLIVGYPGNDRGMVRVFRYAKGQWKQRGRKLEGKNVGGWFGASVAITLDGLHIAVGAPYDTNENGSEAGRVRVFEFVDKDWVQRGTDLIGRAALDHFGISVDINVDGEHLAIGAPNNDDRWQDGGQVHIYEYIEDKGDWKESLKSLKILGDDQGHEFGSAMSLSGYGDTIISSSLVATNDEGTVGGGDPRAVYIAYVDDVAEELGYGFPEIPGTLGLGQAVDIDYDGTKVILATLNLETESGKAMLYDIQGKENWYIYSDEYGGEELGPDEWLGDGPSVSIGGYGDYFAIGYESIVVDPQTKEAAPVVRVYHYGHGPPLEEYEEET